MKFIGDAKILRDKNVWIVDTAATRDMIFVKSEMTNTEKTKESI